MRAGTVTSVRLGVFSNKAELQRPGSAGSCPGGSPGQGISAGLRKIADITVSV